MTTENTTTENETQDRPVSVLLELETYQGMTDSEIDSLIEWKVSNAVAAANNQAIREQNAATNAEILRRQETIISETQALLDSIRATPLTLTVMGGADSNE